MVIVLGENRFFEEFELVSKRDSDFDEWLMTARMDNVVAFLTICFKIWIATSAGG